MQDNFIKKFFIFPLIIVLGITFLGLTAIWQINRGVRQAEAEYYHRIDNPGGDNVSGFAWNPYYGWISFNSSNCDSDIPPDDTVDAGNHPCDNIGDPTHDYGVKIELLNDNILSGFAWNPNLGWISFNNDFGETPPDNFNYSDNCENANICKNPADNCTACYDPATEKIYGWAKILAFGAGDAGWIRLDDDDPGDGFDYGVSIDVTNYETTGFAWGGDDGPDADTIADSSMGWISFSCQDIPTSCDGGTNDLKPCGGAGDCPGGSCVDTCSVLSDYQVLSEVNVAPDVSNLTAPNWGSDQACELNSVHISGTGSALGARLRWHFDDPGDTQTAYRVVVRQGPVFIDTGKCTALGVCSADCGDNPTGSYCRLDPNCLDCEYPLGAAAGVDELDYDLRYHWTVNVWDSFDWDIEAGPKDYDTEPDTHNNDGFSNSFTSYFKEFPRPVINDWFPHNPSQYEEVMFMASSTSYCYSSEDNVDDMCLSGDMKWNWDRIATPLYSAIVPPDPNDDYNASTTVTSFSQSGLQIGMQVELYDADNPDISCSTSTADDEVKLELPDWRESR